MKFEITDIYSIESEPLNFVIKKKYKTKKGKIKQRSVGFFPKLSQAIRRVIQFDLMDADIEGIKAVHNKLVTLNDKIDDLFKEVAK